VQGETTTAFSERMNSNQLSYLTELMQFGPACLDQQEYEARLEVRLQEYYQVLAEGLLQRRGKNYLEFHKTWLRNLGIPLSRRRLFRGFCGAAWNGISHPMTAVKSLFRWWGKAVAPRKKSAGDRA
jgi:hypothetical protein